MRQVIIRKGNVYLANVPSPLIERGHVLVEVAYSLISTGTELGSVQNSGESLAKMALNQPEKIKNLWSYMREQGIEKTVAKVRGKLEEVMPTGYSCSGIVVQVGEGVIDNPVTMSPVPGQGLPIMLRLSWYRAIWWRKCQLDAI